MPENSKMNHHEHNKVICKNQGHMYTLPTLLPLNAPRCIKHFTEQATYKLCSYQFINVILLKNYGTDMLKKEKGQHKGYPKDLAWLLKQVTLFPICS